MSRSDARAISRCYKKLEKEVEDLEAIKTELTKFVEDEMLVSIKVNQAKQHFYDYYLICEKLINLLGQCKSAYETLEKTIEFKVEEDLCGDIIWSQKRVADYYYEYNMSKVQEYETRLQYALVDGPYAYIEYSLLLENYRVQAQKWKEISEICQGKMDLFDEVECFTANLFTGEIEDGFNEIKNMLESMSTVYQNGGFYINHNAEWRAQIKELPACFETVAYGMEGSMRETLSIEQQATNAEYIYYYLTEKGWTLEAICGLLGNIEVEGCLNPGTWQVNDNLNLGYGVVQFAPNDGFLDYLYKVKGYEETITNPVEFLNQIAKENPTLLMHLELEYMEYTSIENSNDMKWGWRNRYNCPYNISYEEYIVAEYSSADMALIFMASYERPNPEKSRIKERVDAANKWYQYLTENVI